MDGLRLEQQTAWFDVQAPLGLYTTGLLEKCTIGRVFLTLDCWPGANEAPRVMPCTIQPMMHRHLRHLHVSHFSLIGSSSHAARSPWQRAPRRPARASPRHAIYRSLMCLLSFAQSRIDTEAHPEAAS